jgi:hypothetical protein
MKQSTSFAMLLGAAMVFFLISCGGNDEKKSSESSTSTDTTTASTTPAAMAVNTTITTPQSMMSVTHKVADFAKWKMAYDDHDSARLANGIHNYVVARGAEDSNMVFVATKVDDMDKAKAFAKDPGLKKAMQKGGVIGTPTISFATMVFQDTAATDSKLRSRTTFKVKDWDAWKTAFDSARTTITDNGLTVRAYGHDPADNHNVVLVTAITDTAKARAYWNSDLLKQRRAASGVIGTPQRFIFTIVQRY